MAKNRENNLYNLKNKVMNRLISENRLEFVGYHKQKADYKVVWLKYYKMSGYGFHVICEKPSNATLDSQEIGEIDSLISSERKISGKMPFNLAVRLLNTYIEER